MQDRQNPISNLFPCLAEPVLARILEAKESWLPEMPWSNDCTVTAYTGCKLKLKDIDVSLDGCHTLDIGLLIEKAGRELEFIAVEVKAGKTNLSPRSVKKLLEVGECRLSSHASQNRLAGNMLALLERKYSLDSGPVFGREKTQPVELIATANNREHVVSNNWIFLGRQRVIKNLNEQQDLFQNAKLISIDEICRNYGREEFNRLVKSMLSLDDYFEEWIENEQA